MAKYIERTNKPRGMTMSYRKKSLLVLVICLMGFLMYSGPAQAEDILYLSSSSQIAEAFGRDVIRRYEKKHETQVNLFVGCSKTALTRLENGFSDLTCIAFRLPQKYRKKGYVDIPFAQDPLVAVTNSENQVDNLSRRQLRNVFMQNIPNWRKLGGEDRKIITVLPRRETALFKNFERQVMEGYAIGYDFMSYLSTQSLYAVKHLPGAISIASLGAVKKHDKLRTINIEGHEPRDAEYPFTQTFSFVSKGEPGPNAREFINAALSESGRKIIREKGMQPILEEKELREAY